MHTSDSIAEKIGGSAVVIRRLFSAMHKAGLITQRKGPNGGARLKHSAKQTGMGDIYRAAEGHWLASPELPASISGTLKDAEQEAIDAMNETTLAQIAKRLKKSK